MADFLEQVDKFVKNLVGARSNMEGHITLTDTEYGSMLDVMRSPADYQSAGKSIEYFYSTHFCTTCIQIGSHY